MDQELILNKNGRCGEVIINRPGALNAITHAMVRELNATYQNWAKDPDIYGIVMTAAGEKAFSAGGDVLSLYKLGQENRPQAIQFFADEYQFDWTLFHFIKPHIAFINGTVMGGGVGVSIFGTHKIAGEKYKFGMPEVGIGFFPDIGGGFFLSRLRGYYGLYLGLTGQTIGAAEAYDLGLATHYIPAAKQQIIIDAVREADPIDPIIEGAHEDPGESALVQYESVINDAFSAPSVEDIISRLKAVEGAHADWAQQTAATIEKKCPLSLKIAFRQITQGKQLNLDEALKVDFRLATRFMEGKDFFEGVRALLIDKDMAPQWTYPSLDHVPEEAVDAYFAPLGENELVLETYWGEQIKA